MSAAEIFPRSSDVAAIYVDPRGPYPLLLTEWWDEKRDARSIDPDTFGLPVVAHPPCGPWGKLSHLCTKQDELAGPHAFSIVRATGGVLEHPASSRLFRAVGAPHPGELPDVYGGVTFEVQQCDWGHPARKRTWIYVCRVPSEEMPPAPARGEPTHWIGGSRRSSSRQGSPVPPGIKVCSPRQARRTPLAFAKWLIEIARRARA